jgi:hypothetical protein
LTPERWFGATGRRVPAIAVDGTIDVAGALVVDGVGDVGLLRDAHARGEPIVVRARSTDDVVAALARPEVSCVLVPDEELVQLDLPGIVYGS